MTERRRLRRAARMAVILPVLAACGLAAGAAWAGDPIAHTPAFPPEGVFVYYEALPLPEPAPVPEPEPVRSVRGLAVREPGVHRWPVVKVIDGNTIKCQVCASV